MARTPNPRFAATIALTIEISAENEGLAEARLEDAVRDFIEDRLRRSTFQRLAGRPRLEYVEVQEASAV